MRAAGAGHAAQSERRGAAAGLPRRAWSQLQNDSNPRLKLIAESVLQGKKLSDALKDVQPGSVLDFNYFVTKIEPILAKPGADGKACVFCHASHVIFKLHRPTPGCLLRPGQRRQLQIRDARGGHQRSRPEPDLIKPTRPTDSAGNVGDYLATHNGGQRWPVMNRAGSTGPSWNGFAGVSKTRLPRKAGRLLAAA